MIARLRDALDIDLPLRSVFERSTLAGIAGAVVDVLLDGQDASVVASVLEEMRSEEEIG